jgi:hypothetical protein
MLDLPSRIRITWGFNAAVFAFGAAMGIVKFLLQSEKAKNVPLDGLVLSISLDAVRYLAVAMISALIVRAFWNRLIADLVPVRALEYQEALAILLVLGVLFGL